MANSPTSKTCTYCNTTKPVSEFGRHKHCKDGLNPQCQQCNRERVAAYQAALGPEYKKRKNAYDKKRWKDGKSKSRRSWRIANREYLNAKKREWADQNPEKARAIKQAYKHRRRAKEVGGISWRELMAWKRSQKPECYWCSVNLTHKTMTVDHYMPLARGGKHEVSNLVPACLPCNRRKNSRDPLEFAREVGRLL